MGDIGYQKKYLLKMPEDVHLKVKLQSAYSGKTMNDLMIEAIKNSFKRRIKRREKLTNDMGLRNENKDL